MRLRRLELQGFKSFSDRTILSFEKGITGVVGPNGCGKSNIVDAILWVMGEQSPKHLRGDSMTDVIFNGSAIRAATSMAEVSLVLDREGVALAPQFSTFDGNDEISITRRIYRDGTAEFLINKTACRLRDIHELFMDTGVGRRAYSIIEQGQIDRMINVKPEDRRQLFEEVAGITKYKAKKKEAEKKLELTRQNILRLQDVVTELEKQIRSLKIQATRARKYKEIKTELEVVDLFLLGRNLHTLEAESHDYRVRKEALVDERSQSDAEAGRLDAELTELEIQRVDKEKEIQRLAEQERDLALSVQKLESQLSILDERTKFLTQTSEESQEEEHQIVQKEEQLASDKTALLQERSDLETSVRDIELEITERDGQLSLEREEVIRLHQRKGGLQKRVNELAQRSVHLESQERHAKERQAELVASEMVLKEKIDAIVSGKEGLHSALIQMDEKIALTEERSRETEAHVSSLHGEIQQTSQALSESEARLYQTRELFHSKRSKLESLKELQENLEGYSPTARELLLRLEGTGTTAVPLAEIFQPEAEIEEHLEIFLGADMNALVVPTVQDADMLAGLITERNLERVRLIPLSAVRVHSPHLANAAAVPLLSKVRVKEGYEALAQAYFGEAFLGTTTDDLVSHRSQSPDTNCIALDKKWIAHSNGSLSAGTPPSRTGIFARRREIEELEGVSNTLAEQVKEMETERERLLTQLKTQEQLRTEVKERLSSIHIESVGYRKEREKIQLEWNRAERDEANSRREAEQMLSQLSHLATQIENVLKELGTVSEERTQVSSELDSFEEHIRGAEAQVAVLSAQLGERKIESSKFAERLHGLVDKIAALEAQQEDLDQRLHSLRAQRARDEEELRQIGEEKVSTSATREEASLERAKLVSATQDLRSIFADVCEKLQTSRNRKDELQSQRERVLTQVQELELKAASVQAQLEQIRSLSIERYHREPVALDEKAKIEIEKLPLFTSQLNVTFELLLPPEQHSLLTEHLTNCKEKIERYGEVNLTAITEFEDIQKRYDFLMEQKTDLEKSIDILEQAILKIDESTKTRFAETFEVVNKKFKEIFPVLFNGGKGELSMTAPENPLDSGIDVLAQPPGKKLQSITLLSGGEKALTAVSLILAIFARKPSPFCLLDEVDAPLDDANVSRFNTVIRKMSEKTQFIVITHNKKTMEIAEALYGVTMERSGISKMTSVRLN